MDSPGPAYDVSGSLLFKSFHRKVGTGATFGTGQRFAAHGRGLDGPGPGKYNSRDANFALEKGPRDGGAASLTSGEARTMLFDNAKRAWGASTHRNGAFFPPEGDYFQRPSPHARCANPQSALKAATSRGVHAFAKAQRKSSELPPMLSSAAAEFGLSTSSNRLYQVRLERTGGLERGRHPNGSSRSLSLALLFVSTPSFPSETRRHQPNLKMQLASSFLSPFRTFFSYVCLH